MNLFTDDDNMNNDRAKLFTDDSRMTSYKFDNMNQQPVMGELSPEDYVLLQASLKKAAAAEKNRQHNQEYKKHQNIRQNRKHIKNNQKSKKGLCDKRKNVDKQQNLRHNRKHIDNDQMSKKRISYTGNNIDNRKKRKDYMTRQ